MSEFGRTAQQNGTGGTDHGHANVMFVLGGSVKGGKVYGKWPGMATEQLYQNRDLAITTDFRQVLGEAAYKTLGARNLELVFPGSELKTDAVSEFDELTGKVSGSLGPATSERSLTDTFAVSDGETAIVGLLDLTGRIEVGGLATMPEVSGWIFVDSLI